MLKFIYPMIAVCSAIASGPLAATTLADLSPTSLPGKTLELTFEGGDSETPLSGTWTATFGKSPSKGITISNFPGQSVSSTTTWTHIGAPFPDSHGYALTSSPAFGSKPAEITLWVSESGVRFYLTIDGVSNYGGVVFKSVVVLDEPDISIFQPGAKPLTDGATAKTFGNVKVGEKSAAKIFKIKNTGTSKLTKLSIRESGAGKKDFVVSTLRKTSLPEDGSVSFEVKFRPTTDGVRKATIRIISNDPDENPFDIKLVGQGRN